MNAATLLATLPVFFLDRRDRQPRQYAMLGILWCVAIAYGAWVMATGNPLGADYRSADWLFAPRAARLVAAVLDEPLLVHSRRGNARIHPLGGRCRLRPGRCCRGGRRGASRVWRELHGETFAGVHGETRRLPAADRPATAATRVLFTPEPAAPEGDECEPSAEGGSPQGDRGRWRGVALTGPWSGARAIAGACGDGRWSC